MGSSESLPSGHARSGPLRPVRGRDLHRAVADLGAHVRGRADGERLLARRARRAAAVGGRSARAAPRMRAPTGASAGCSLPPASPSPATSPSGTGRSRPPRSPTRRCSRISPRSSSRSRPGCSGGRGRARQFLVGLALSLAGVALLVRASLGFSSTALLGDAFGVITAMFYAWYLLTVKRLRDLGTATLRLMAVTTTLTAAILLPVALASGEAMLPAGASGWLVLLGLALDHARRRAGPDHLRARAPAGGVLLGGPAAAAGAGGGVRLGAAGRAAGARCRSPAARSCWRGSTSPGAARARRRRARGFAARRLVPTTPIS